MKEYAFGIDLGGTTAKIGLFKTTGALLEKWEVPTDTSNAGEHILKNLAAAVQGKMQEKGLAAEQVEGVGVGVPGPVLDSRIVPIICANLGGWGKHNVAEELGGMLSGIKVLVGNDATWLLWARSGWVPPRAAAVRSWSRWAPAWAVVSSSTARSLMAPTVPAARSATSPWTATRPLLAAAASTDVWSSIPVPPALCAA